MGSRVFFQILRIYIVFQKRHLFHMNKPLILIFVFAAISFSTASAQNISRPKTDNATTEQKTDKATPTDAQSGKTAPTGRKARKAPVTEKSTANGKTRSERKGDNGKHKGHDKDKAKGKAKGHHKNHDHEAKPGEGRTKEKSKSKGKKSSNDKDSKVPEDASKGRKAKN